MLALAFESTGAAAQNPSDSEPTSQDIAVRNELIAAQESLLNVYRCRFAIDVQAVGGGCANGQPRLGPIEPRVFEGTPTQPEKAVRDELIEEQESLLNDYRCRFSIDTQVVPGGCAALDEERLASLVLAGVNDLRGGLAPLTLDHRLSTAARTRAHAQAEAFDWQQGFDYEPLLRSDWEVWVTGWSAWVDAGLDDPTSDTRLSVLLLDQSGFAMLTCEICTHLGVGIATHRGRTYATTVFAAPAPTEAALAAAEAEMAALVNELRDNLGLNALSYHSAIAEVARRWSHTMAVEQNFMHNPNLAQQYPAGWLSSGENISWNYPVNSLSDAVLSSFNGLVYSPGHYANMISPEFTHLGVGIALEDGRFWVTQNFASFP